MRHSLYVNNTKVTPTKKKSINKDFSKNPISTTKRSLDDEILKFRISALMDYYRKSPDIIADIKNKTDMFLINLTIVREVHSKEQEKMLKKEFSKYLSTLEKKENSNNVK